MTLHATCSSTRLDALRRSLAHAGARGLAVAYSGGVDSSVLLHAAHAVLGARCVALVADSPSLPRAELEDARRFTRALGVERVELATNELELDGYRANDGLRCFWCRHTLFRAMEAWARRRGFGALAYGEIADDRLDDRPGRRAAQAFSVLAPLAEAGLTKHDVRAYARRHGLPAAEKPASACLASRLPRGTEVTRERLLRIERAESALRPFGFRQLRVRDHGSSARVEVDPTDLARARALAPSIAKRLVPLGFQDLRLAAYHRPELTPGAVGSALEDRQQALG